MWEEIQAFEWKKVPYLSGRPATEADVEEGRAVFYVEGDTTPADLPLPCCAFQLLEDGSEEAVVIIQAEETAHGVTLGVRPLSGGNAVCMLEEVRLLVDGFE